MPRRLSTQAWVTVAEFIAATDKIIRAAGKSFHWASGGKGSNWEPALVARFGAPIITVPNLNPSLRILVQTGTSHSESEYGVGTALDFVMGQNGLTKVCGIIGGYHAAISMPIASLAAVLEVPQVSYASTSPKLSNKAAYPYFSRTIPPDSIQGSGMWRFLVYLQVPIAGYFHSQSLMGKACLPLFQAWRLRLDKAIELYNLMLST